LKESTALAGTPVTGAITAISGKTLAVRAFTYASQAVNALNFINGYIPLREVGE
jgi:hypothetical protein